VPARPFSASKVRAQLDRRLADLRVCAMPGTDRLRFTLKVSPEGSVHEVQASPASYRQCVLDQLAGAVFPASDDGGELTYTFTAKDAPKPATKSKKPSKNDPTDDLLPVGQK
jgi:hypothetical protein